MSLDVRPRDVAPNGPRPEYSLEPHRLTSKGRITLTRLPLWRSLAATLLLVAVLVLLHAPIGNAARHDETPLPSSCDEMMTDEGMGRDDRHMGTPGSMMNDGSHMGTPGTGMDRDDSHMDARDGDMPCDDAHRGSPVAGDDCRDMMGSPVSGMGPGARRMGTPGTHMDCVSRDGTPSAGTRRITSTAGA